MVEPKLSADVAEVSPIGPGPAQGRRQGDADAARSAGKSVEVPVTVLGLNTPVHVDFVHDVNPVLSRLGCNAGTCHGSAQGKNGFKLSLRGYDPLFDVRALTDDQAVAARQPRLARRQPDAAEADRRACRTSAAC